jgi:SUMO ligase MMS21 Smc5/6 complex component
MNCLALLAHCHRTGTRIRILETLHYSNHADSTVVHVANVMEASLYDRSPVRTVISPDAMQHLLQTAVVLHPSAPDNDECCPITQDKLMEGDAVLVLPCGHSFMKDAIQTWLETESAECPVCRHALPSREITTMKN